MEEETRGSIQSQQARHDGNTNEDRGTGGGDINSGDIEDLNSRSE